MNNKTTHKSSIQKDKGNDYNNHKDNVINNIYKGNNYNNHKDNVSNNIINTGNNIDTRNGVEATMRVDSTNQNGQTIIIKTKKMSIITTKTTSIIT